MVERIKWDNIRKGTKDLALACNSCLIELTDLEKELQIVTSSSSARSPVFRFKGDVRRGVESPLYSLRLDTECRIWAHVLMRWNRTEAKSQHRREHLREGTRLPQVGVSLWHKVGRASGQRVALRSPSFTSSHVWLWQKTEGSFWMQGSKITHACSSAVSFWCFYLKLRSGLGNKEDSFA